MADTAVLDDELVGHDSETFRCDKLSVRERVSSLASKYCYREDKGAT